MDRARALVAQHAETSRLLGVGFVPSYRTSADIAEPVQEPDQPAAEISIKPTPATRGLSARDRLDALQARYQADAPHSAFNTSFTNIVFGEGDPEAGLMFVGEAPGAEEDRTGRPFVGRSGLLLDKMIVAMGLSREAVYIANVLKTRPPNNATPTIEEAKACAPYLHEQIRIIAPRVIVTLGLPAAHLLLETTDSMRNLRGRWHQFPPAGVESSMYSGADPMDPIAVMPTYHPAFLLRSYTEDNRRKVWSDLKQAMERLVELGC